MVAHRTTKINLARFAPYPSSASHGQPYGSKPDENKENQASPTPGSLATKSSRPGNSKNASLPKPKSPPAKASTREPDRSGLPNHYLDIQLEEKPDTRGEMEVPCYEDAAAVRRKLKALIEKKVKIPNSNKTFNQSNLAKELQEVAKRTHPVRCYQSKMSSGGPSPRALSAFLKKTGTMGGGDSESFYFGTILLEKLRIWNEKKKTAAREKAEEKFPRGRVRLDPDTCWITCRADEVPTRQEIANEGR
ncbi:hypothetical protein BU23DRAFT_548536 [Bimuria novae-zelandiae CBS 107.79]|uniref:Uncharacterized protein n=1 Tax=Bimuria novae-zelandiae CBS 107.79 TaxID=1447943 RepID=A0A6A5W4G5_9PLEO|nr:hypothetical protein BU23DRAFT_548536 [Bimuria novae-zelandiae CBS 107.79]